MPITISGDGGITGLNLSDFGDINSTALSDSDALVYDASAGEWVAEPVDLSAVTGVLPSSALPAGVTKQVVQTVKTDTFSTSSTSFVDVTGLSVTITPTSATSDILVIANVMAGTGSTQVLFLTLTDGSDNNLVSASSPGNRRPSFYAWYGNATGNMLPASFSLLHSPATTSAFTYKVRMAVGGVTHYVNRMGTDTDSSSYPRGVSTLTAIEVAA